MSLEKTRMILWIFPGIFKFDLYRMLNIGFKWLLFGCPKSVCVCVSINFVVKLCFFFSKKSFLQTFNWNYLSPQIWQSLFCGLKVFLINGYLFDRANKLWAKKGENKVVISVFWNEDSFFSLLKGCVKTYVSNILNHCN